MLSWSVTICLAVKLFDVANQSHCYIDNSLRTWEYPIGDPVQFPNWFLAWKWGCVLLWPEVIFFFSALRASLTRLRRELSIRKKYPLEPRVVASESISKNFGFIRLEKGEIFWKETSKDWNNAAIKAPWANWLVNVSFCSRRVNDYEVITVDIL